MPSQLWSVPPWYWPVAAAFVASALLPIEALRIPIPLYLAAGPTTSYVPNVPQLPVVPIIVATLAAATVRRRVWPSYRDMLIGLGLGVGGSMYAGLVIAAGIAFQTDYVATAYRLYTFLALIAVTGLVVAICGRSLRATASGYEARRALLWSVLAVVAGAAGLSVVQRSFLVGAAVLVGAVFGFAFALQRSRQLPGRFLFTADRVAVMLAVAAFIVRAAFGLSTLARTGPGIAFAIASDDGDSYFRLSGELIAAPSRLAEIIATPAFPPGYTLFLALLRALTHGDLGLVVIVQSLLAAFCAIIVYILARELASRNVALVATALFALDANLIQNGATLTAEALLMPAMLASILGLVRYRLTRRLSWSVAAALALGLAFIVRNVAAFPLVGAMVISLFLWERREPRRLVRDAALLLVAILIFSLPIAVATGLTEGTPRLTTQLAELTFGFVGGEPSTVSNQALLDRDIRPFSDPAGSLGRFLRDPLPVVGFLVGAAPQRVSTLLFSQTPGASDPLLLVNPIFFPNAFGDWARLLRAAALVLAIGAIFALRSWRQHPDITLYVWFGLLYVAIFAFVFPPYHPFRYRIPIEPMRFIAEAIGLAAIFKYLSAPWFGRDCDPPGGRTH